MSALQVVLPMAGLGSRFARAGFELPKPLIPVDGLPMFRKALSSLDQLGDQRVAAIIRREHVEAHGLDDLIRAALPEAEVVVLDEMTRGAAETAVAARGWLEPASPVVVMDCDLWFASASYESMIRDGGSVAGVLTFRADDPRYSYARVEGDRVVETAEKRVISDLAITGAYFFRRGDVFLSAADALLARPLSADPEYYMSNVMGELVRRGDDVAWASVDEFASFGTPEELARYEEGR